MVLALVTTAQGRRRRFKQLFVKWAKWDIYEIGKYEKRAKASTDGFTEVTCKNWIIRTEFDKRFTAEAARFMEVFTSTFMRAFGSIGRPFIAERPILCIYATKAKYDANPRTIKGSGGIFSFVPRGARKVRDLKLFTFHPKGSAAAKFGEFPLSITQHEGTHALLAKIYGQGVPLWLNEGFATFFETLDLQAYVRAAGNDAALNKARKKRREMSYRHLILKQTLGPLGFNPPKVAYLMSLDTPQEWNPDGMGPRCATHYALAESFVDMMLSSRFGRSILAQLRGALAKQKKPLISDAMVKKLEPAWHQFLVDEWGVPVAGVRKRKGKK